MKQNESLVVRTLTEAMLNAYTLNDEELQAAIKRRLLKLLVVPEAPEAPAQPVADEVSNERPMTDYEALREAVRLATKGECVHCVILEVIKGERVLAVSAEDLIYVVGREAGYDHLSDMMKHVADDLLKVSEETKDLKVAMRYADFTKASVVARERLVQEGLAPALKFSAKIMESALGASLESLLAQLQQRAQQ